MLPQKHPATPRAPSFSSSSSSSPPPLPNDLHSSSIQRSTAQPHSQQDLQQLHLSPLSHSQQLHLLPSSSSAAASFSSSSSSSSPPQHPLDDQQLHDYHQQLRFQQQRLLLQQQQQQALIQLQNLQIRQKKKLQEEHQRHFQQQSYLQHQEPHQQRQQQQVQEEHPQLSFSSPSSSPTTQAPSISTKDFATHQHLQQSSLVQAQPYQPSLFAPLLGSSSQEGGPSGLISAPAPAVSMDILAMAPFPLHQPHSFASGPVAIQQPMQHLSAQDQPFKQLYQVSGTPGNPFHPLKYETGQSLESQPTNPVTADTSGSGGINGCQSNGWIRSEGALLTESLFRSDTQDPLRRLSNSSAGTDLSSRSPGLVHEMSGYTLDARIIQKKDQMEDVSPTGEIIQASAVEEVRTGQQFLIKLQLTKQGTPAQPAGKFPTMRVDRRDAINTAGEPRSEAEPLTLQIIVHLAKSGQIRKGACAKCCHKYGPSSPILVLLDPLSPSVTDPSSFAHIDISSGAVTILAKVICSSTDHGERGNKDRYIFEFRLKRAGTMQGASWASQSPINDENNDIVAKCYTAPIMCSGHHKAKRIYPSQRPAKVTKDGVVPKTKVIKHKDVGNIFPVQTSTVRHPSEEFLRSESVSSNSNYPSPLSLVQDNLTNVSVMSNFGDDQPIDFDLGSDTSASVLPASTMDSPINPTQQILPQLPRISEIRPNHGPIRKTTDVVLRGSSFREGMVPYFGCFPAQDVAVETSSLIICKAPEYSMAVTVPISICDNMGNSFANLSQFTYTEESETELLILQLQLRLAHRALEFLHSKTTGQHGRATDIMREIGITSSSTAAAGGNMMIDSAEDSALLTRVQVEEGILKTLDELPTEVDISMSLDGQGNLLHFSILLGFDKLTMRLIEGGCEFEALDAWGMTPLMYAVLKGNERVVRSLVMAGASSSGATTPQEFYSRLPHAITPTLAVAGYLSVACTRYSISPDTMLTDNHDDSQREESMEPSDGEISSPGQSGDQFAPQAVDQTMSTVTEISTTVTTGRMESVGQEGELSLTQLERTIRNVHLTHDMPPLDQQGLPPLHIVADDGSITINQMILKGEDIRANFSSTDISTAEKEDSAYYSGVASEVKAHLSQIQGESLPSAGVQMSVMFSRDGSSTDSKSASIPENLFRTGDRFNIEIRLATIPVPGAEYVPLPTEALGIRLPHEMVKRVKGEEQVSILHDLTYSLRVSIEHGHSQTTMTPGSSSSSSVVGQGSGMESRGNGIELKSACQKCANYPIFQFYVSMPPTQVCTEDDYVLKVKDGLLHAQARVNCSSLHIFTEREIARLRLQQQQQQNDPTTKAKAVLDSKDFVDPGYVFKFELVHPTLETVVAKCEAGPILFQKFSRTGAGSS